MLVVVVDSFGMHWDHWCQQPSRHSHSRHWIKSCRVERMTVPELGSGWGNLQESVIWSTICSFRQVSKQSIHRLSDYPKFLLTNLCNFRHGGPLFWAEFIQNSKPGLLKRSLHDTRLTAADLEASTGGPKNGNIHLILLTTAHFVYISL